MRLHELADALELLELTPPPGKDVEVDEGYTSDLLSDILANAPAGGVLVTIQASPDVITVASLAALRAVIFSSGRRPDEHVVERGTAEGLCLFSAQADSFQLVGRLYERGVRGKERPRTAPPSPPRGHRRRHLADLGWRRITPELLD